MILFFHLSLSCFEEAEEAKEAEEAEEAEEEEKEEEKEAGKEEGRRNQVLDMMSNILEDDVHALITRFHFNL